MIAEAINIFFVFDLFKPSKYNCASIARLLDKPIKFFPFDVIVPP